MWSDFLDFRATTVTLELPRRLGNRRLPGERPSATPPLTTAPTLEVIVSSGECHRRVEVVDTGCEMDDLGVWVSMPGLWHSTGCCSPGGAAYMDITVLKTIGHADLHRCADPPCGVAPLMRPAAGPGPASNIPVPRPQARPGTRPTQHTPPQKPLFRRFCPRVSSPIFAPKKPPPRFLFRPASVFSHTLLYTFGPAPASQAAARSVPCSGHLASTENFDRGWGHPGRPGVTR